MSTPTQSVPRKSLIQSHAGWAVVLAALAVLYVPTFMDLAGSLWRTDQNGHGPIVLAVAVWFLSFRLRQALALPDFEARPAAGPALLCFAIGFSLYVLGRSQQFYFFEVGSLPWVVAGCVLLFYGRLALRHAWFAFFFMLFMIPLPGSVTDAVTQPMKVAVSWGAEHLLYALGYPIARSGVVLTIGPYQLLVADACAGLNSLFTLEALGLLYMNLMRHESAFRNFALAVFIVPISFTSNLIRVVVLALVTFHFGDEAGQGFVHSFSGMVLFISALFLIISLDSLFRALASKLGASGAKR